MAYPELNVSYFIKTRTPIDWQSFLFHCFWVFSRHGFDEADNSEPELKVVGCVLQIGVKSASTTSFWKPVSQLRSLHRQPPRERHKLSTLSQVFHVGLIHLVKWFRRCLEKNLFYLFYFCFICFVFFDCDKIAASPTTTTTTPTTTISTSTTSCAKSVKKVKHRSTILRQKAVLLKKVRFDIGIGLCPCWFQPMRRNDCVFCGFKLLPVAAALLFGIAALCLVPEVIFANIHTVILQSLPS